ncbi:MAG: ribonuclease catalytic domain-containing protein [Treponema sp.]|nr:ribonuclease catalytic domain-containing protein [Treponema sp.]
MTENSLVIYKEKPALVKNYSEGKFTIALSDGSQIKVRDKDIELLHPGPLKDLNGIADYNIDHASIKEAWEYLTEEDSPVSVKDFCALAFNEYTPFTAYAAYSLLKDGLYFCGKIDAILPRSKDDVAADEIKRGDKQRETDERIKFLERLKLCYKKPEENKMLPDDTRFIQDAEALAFGKSAKSRTMKELGFSETPEDAHALLLKTGFWTNKINPHPARFGLSLSDSVIRPDEPPNEDRKDLCRLDAFAIDSPWSNDPDDAVSIEETENGNSILYVHIADPASSVTFDSPAEKEARDRGATLYLPEKITRMLADDFLPVYALGVSDKSPALTFKMTINENGAVTDTEIFPSIVKVTRLTYEEADKVINTKLSSLYKLSQKIFKRRELNGCVNIEFPDVYISAVNGEVKIQIAAEYQSSSLVRECMLAAGEGAGTWAASRGITFPYISQEVELQGKIINGLAGSMQLRKCMRPRVLSVKPGRHQGLGLDTYSQVTSPLRRYTDLLSHMQIRAFLRGENTLGADEVSARLGFSEAAAIASVQAERASNNYWIMVYLSDKKDSLWNAVALENKGSRWQVIIPSLALETQVALQKDAAPNDEIKLILKSVNIAKGEAVFLHA